MGEIISLLGFWGFSGGVRRRPQTTQTVFGETVERQDSDEAQTKGKTRMVKFITIRGTRALSATPYYKGHGGVRAERWCCACAHCRLCVRKRTNLQPLQASVQADKILLRNNLRCLNLASFGGLRFYCVINCKVSYLALPNEIRGKRALLCVKRLHCVIFA